MRFDDVVFEQRAEMNRARSEPRGVVVFGSHLGNLEVLRALRHARLAREAERAGPHARTRIRFNRILRLSGATDVELVQVTSFDPTTAFSFARRWIAASGS